MKKLNIILPLALIICLMVSCQDKEAMAELEEFRAQVAVQEANKALFMRYSEAWESGDIETLKEIISPDFIWHTAMGQDLSLEKTREACERQMAMYPDWTIVNEDVIVKGDKIVTRYTFSGTHEGDIEGFPASGNKIETTGIEILRVENGKIIESWEAGDMLSLYQQLGYKLKKKEEKGTVRKTV